MAQAVTKKEETNVAKTAAAPVKGILNKIAKLADLLGKAEWAKDGVNAHQKYKYISEAQYKRVHGQAVAEAGLIFKFTILDREFFGNVTEKMHLTTIKVQMEYIDPETGEREVYHSFGDGMDNGDKGLYKAETGAYKYHIATNFHVAEYNDPEGDDSVKPKSTSTFGSKGGFMSGREQAEAKTKVLAGEEASAADVKKLTKAFKEYEVLHPDRASAFRTSNPDFSKIKAVAMKQILPNITEVVAKSKENSA